MYTNYRQNISLPTSRNTLQPSSSSSSNFVSNQTISSTIAIGDNLSQIEYDHVRDNQELLEREMITGDEEFSEEKKYSDVVFQDQDSDTTHKNDNQQIKNYPNSSFLNQSLMNRFTADEYDIHCKLDQYFQRIINTSIISSSNSKDHAILDNNIENGIQSYFRRCTKPLRDIAWNERVTEEDIINVVSNLPYVSITYS